MYIVFISISCLVLLPAAVIIGFAEDSYNFTEGMPSADQMVCVTILEGEIQSSDIQVVAFVSAVDGTAEGKCC